MKISAIIPAYNAAPWLARAIHSVLQQTIAVDEIIVCDDGSTDNTAKVCAQFRGCVRYIRQTNGGPAKARNTAIHDASGDWLALLDADDWWLPRRLEMQLQALDERPDAVLAYGSIKLVEDSGATEVRIAPSPDELWPMLRYRNPIAPSAVLVKRDALEQIGGFNPRHRGTEDWEAWVRLHRMGPFARVAQPLACYRVAPSSLSSNADHMFHDFQPMLEETLVADLKGISRSLWRRRILSYQAYTAAKTARGAGDRTTAAKYLRISLAKWPSPFWQPRRLLTLAATMKQGLAPGRHPAGAAVSPTPAQVEE
jgi:glycosyltransferase involved in cell wall biosynthesis